MRIPDCRLHPTTTSFGGVAATANGGDWAGDWIAGSVWNDGFTDGEYLLFGIGTNIMTLDFAAPINAFGTQAWYDQLGGDVTRVRAPTSMVLVAGGLAALGFTTRRRAKKS